MKQQDSKTKQQGSAELKEAAASTSSATASALQSEIDLYRQASARYKKRAKRKTVTALCFLAVCVLGTLGLVAMAILARFELISPIAPLFFYSIVGSILLLLLIGLCFFVSSRDDRSLVDDCEACIAEREERLRIVKKQIEEERRRAQEADLRVVETLPSMQQTPAQRLAHALRVTSAILSAMSIPISAIAALCKEKNKK